MSMLYNILNPLLFQAVISKLFTEAIGIFRKEISSQKTKIQHIPELKKINTFAILKNLITS